MTTCRLSELLAPPFHEVHRAVKAGTVGEVVAKGGRGSCKSSYLSVELVLQLLTHPDCHAVVLRRVGNTLRASVYAQICWAVTALGLAGKFRCTVSPMECVYRPTGQKILFFGLDDPGKLKSLKLPFGYAGIAWFEELDQFAGPEEVRNAEQSIFRGGDFSLSLKSFNPPAMARSWANQYALETSPRRLVHHSSYLTTPPQWLGPRFLADAEELRSKNETAYRHEYLGEVVGSGTAVFENLRPEAIPEEQVRGFDRRYHGVDWGYWPDPWAYNAMAYDAARRVLFVYDELTRYRAGNADTAKLLLDRKVCQGPDEKLTADSAEPKSIGDYRAAGLPCRKVEKGPGSVDYRMKWPQSLAAIVIDPARCPDTVKEFSEYEYQRDRRTGVVLEGYPDAANHHIDAVSYGMYPVWKRRGK